MVQNICDWKIKNHNQSNSIIISVSILRILLALFIVRVRVIALSVIYLFFIFIHYSIITLPNRPNQFSGRNLPLFAGYFDMRWKESLQTLRGSYIIRSLFETYIALY